MDATDGLLMAVKQVDLPSAASINNERKQQMLNALEREIELLKDLQHEHIVQYLCTFFTCCYTRPNRVASLAAT